MREIKFKFWNTVTECMYEDTGITSLGINDGIEKAEEAHYIFLQYIGRKDKNGKEICEGDIVKYNGSAEEHIGINEIIYEENFARFSLMFNTHEPPEGHGADYLLCGIDPEPDDELEIIGNIYENPELNQ